MFYCVAKKATETLYWCQMLKLAPSPPPQKRKEMNSLLSADSYTWFVRLWESVNKKNPIFRFQKSTYESVRLREWVLKWKVWLESKKGNWKQCP